MSFSDSALELERKSAPAAVRPARRAPAQDRGWADVAREDDDVLSPELVTDLAERYDRLRPATAGLLAGGAAGVLMLAAADRVLHARGGALDLVQFVGRLVSKGALVGLHAQLAGFGAALVAGAVIGVLFAKVTRHLRRFAPLLLWSLVFFPAAWTLLQAFVLPVAAPWLAPMLPFVPMLAGTAVYAAVVSLQLLLRKGRPPVAY